MTREERQAKLLEYLYDLLEADERAEIERWLAQEPAAQAALKKAEEEKRLLLAAAKTRFAEVSFQPPANRAVPRSLPMPKARRHRPRARWAVAAAVGLAILTGAAIYWNSAVPLRDALADADRRHDTTHKRLQDAERPIGEKQRQITQLVSQLQKQTEDFRKTVAEMKQASQDRTVYCQLAGPANLEAGAPNFFHLVVHNLNDQPVDAKLSARLVDQKQRVIVPEKLLAFEREEAGTYRLVLPPTLDLPGNSPVHLIVAAKPDDGPATELGVDGRITVTKPVYLTHLATDKPMYQPGETVYFRSLTLNRTTFKPPPEELRLHYSVTSPNGEELFRMDAAARLVDPQSKQPILGPDKEPLRGIGAGAWTLEPNLKGGEYTLTVNEASGRFPPTQRKFLVNRYEKPRMKKELEFTRKSYGPGDAVVAACKVSPAEGGQALANRPVQATVIIDGKQYGVDGQVSDAPIRAQTDALGAVAVRFKLPVEIDRGDASLAVQFTDGANVETIVRPIPVVVNKLYVELFPEGGDLAAGVPNRVYFQARTTLDKPAELSGCVVDQDGKEVARFETLHDDHEPGANQGMGAFTFVPTAGNKYELKLDRPDGIKAVYTFPEVKADGIVLNIPQAVISAKEAIQLTLRSAQRDRKVLVGAYCRGRLMATKSVDLKAGTATPVELESMGGIGGVYRVTVFEARSEKQFVPLAERLIYRNPAETLHLTMQALRAKYMPGEKAKLAVEATDETGQATPAIAMLAVVDKNLLTLADEKTHRLMPTYFFLTNEVRKPEDLEHTDFLLGKHPKAAAALDLLLGTQGWRRFAEQKVEQFREQYQDDADRYLVSIGQTLLQANNYEAVVAAAAPRLALAMEKKRTEYANADGKARRTLDETRQEYKQLLDAAGPGIRSLAQELRTADHDRRTAADNLAVFTQSWQVMLLAAAGGLLLVFGIGSLVRGMAQEGRQAAWSYRLAAGCLSLLIIGLIWVGQGGMQQIGNQFSDHLALSRLDIQREAQEVADEQDFNRSVAIALDRLAEEERVAAPESSPESATRLFAERGWGGGGAGRGGWAGAGGAGFGGGGMPRGGAKDPNVDGFAPFGFGMPPAAMNRPGGQQAEGRANLPERLGELGPNQGLPLVPRGEMAKEADKAKAGLADNRAKYAEGLERKRVAGDKDGVADYALKRQADDRSRPPGAVANGQPREQKPEVPRPEAALGAARPAPAGKPGAGGMAPGGPGMADEPVPGLRAGRRPYPGVPGMAPAPEMIPPAAAGGFGVNGAEQERRHLRLDAGAGLRQAEKSAPQPPPCIVRQYAHLRSLGVTGARGDMTETLYWHPALVLPDGKATVEFDLCDSLTTFQVLAYGHTIDGRIGAATYPFESRLPFSVEPKIPLEVTATDKIDLPVAIANDTDDPRKVSVGIHVNGLALTGSASTQLDLAANQRVRRLFRLQPKLIDGIADLELDGRGGPLANDSIHRQIRVVPDGFPVTLAKSDVIEKVAVHDIVLPESWLPGTLKLHVQVYPSTLAELQQGLEGLLREPHGCFEQTSSSNYPNVLILNYLKETDQAKPAAAARARDLVDRGYQKLISFECQNNAKKVREGYEWFGGAAPPHEALTAYGLMEFRDMAGVYPVDKNMVERTRAYLLSCRDGQGGFKRNPRALDSFGRAPEDITNAYIVWALTEGGIADDVSKELMALKLKAKVSDDPYFLSLVANSLINRDQAEDAVAVLKKVAAVQKADGHLDAAATSITGSGGRDLQIETTALALLGWLKANRPAEFAQNVHHGIKWLGQQRGGHGGFGSTQSTVLALKALIAFARANKKTADAGELVLKAGNQELGRLKFAAGMQEPLTIATQEVLGDKAALPLHAGNNTVRVEISGNNVLPYTLTWSYQTLKPVSAEDCPLKLETKLDRTTANEGEVVRLGVKLQNASGKGQGMVVAIIGLPAGLTLPEDFKQLKDYTRLRDHDTKPGRISAWETQGRELVLYWRDLAPDAVIELPIDLICRVPGEYRGPASRGYLYYNADRKCWVEPLSVIIKAKAE